MPLGSGSTEPDPVILLEINSLPRNLTANILEAATITQWAKGGTTALHPLYLALDFQNEKL